MFSLVARSEELKCSKNGTDIIFINGVDTTFDEGAGHEKKLIRLINEEVGKGKIDKDSKVDVGFRYNRSQGAIFDFLEAGAQSLNSQSGGETSIEEAYGEIAKLLFSWPGSLLSDAIVEQVLADKISTLTEMEQEDVDGLKKDIKDTLSTDRKLILVSHSQGNFFITRALEELEGFEGETNGKLFKFNNYKKFIGNLRVSSPQDKEIAYSAETVLNNQDFLHNYTLVRIAANPPEPTFSLVKPENTVDFRDEADRKVNHGFSSTYLFRITDWDGYLIQEIPDPVQRSYVRAQHLSLDALGKQTLDRLVEVAEGLPSNCAETCTEVSSSITFEAYRHANPDGSEGGLVSVEAFVAPTVTVDPAAVVCGRAHVLDNVKIYDSARVDGSALITKNAVIADDAYITGNSFVTDDARVAGKSFLENAPIVSGFSIISGTSILSNTPLVDGSASVEGSILVDSSNVVDEAIVMNDALLVTTAIVAENAKLDEGVYVSQTSLVAGSAIIKGLTYVTGNALVLGGNITSTATESMFERLNISVDTIILDSPTINGLPSFASNTLVRGNASILENAIIGNGSAVSDEATVKGSAYIQDTVVANRAQVSGNVNSYSGYILDDAVVRDFVSIFQGKIYGSASVSGNAYVSGQVYENAFVFGSASIYGRVHGNAQVSGTTIVASDESVN